MVLEYAPVTGLTLIIGVISSSVTLDHYMQPIINPLMASAAAAATSATSAKSAMFMHGRSREVNNGNFHRGNSRGPLASSSLIFKESITSSLLSLVSSALTVLPVSVWSLTKAVSRLSLEAIPFAPWGSALSDMLCTMSIIYQMRTLERRWGSNSFLAFQLTASAVGIAASHLFVSESSLPMLSVTAVRVISSVASLVPLVALTTRYVQEIPNTSSLSISIPFTNYTITDKVCFIAPLIKLVVWPNKELQSSGYKRRAVMMDLGLWTRLLLALIGFLFGIFSSNCKPIEMWLKFFRNWFCRPLLSFLRPLLTVIFGPPSTIEHILPKEMQRAHLAEQQTGRFGEREVHNEGYERSRRRHNHNHNQHHRYNNHNFNNNSNNNFEHEYLYSRESEGNRDVNLQASEHGRVVVDNLAGFPASPQFAMFSPLPTMTTMTTTSSSSPYAPQQGSNVSLRSRPPNYNNNNANSGSAMRNRHAAASYSHNNENTLAQQRFEAQIASIEELNLMVSQSDIINALTQTNGNVNDAVQLLLERELHRQRES